ncbi:hypothetical protein DNTS_013387 [Danionella cerebrum]|uniref:PH domain-containing protein n=1 Tax=Danionella cerebrum TaxID=2873325 RepID=A0A553PWA7_9TELE|nr:hypothetical protein DNTS_013387 [Danionella translucida]
METWPRARVVTRAAPVVVAPVLFSLFIAERGRGDSALFISPSDPPRGIGVFMGRVAAPCNGPGRIVSFLTAVPCLSCKQHHRRAQHQSAALQRGNRRRMNEQGKSASCTTLAPGSDTYKGWLFKWTNYIKGYQRRWFVLSNGLLSYYR